MARFLDPPAAKPLLPKEKIDSTYKSMRFKVFLGAFLGYAGYYLVRKNLSLAAPGMIADGLVTKAQVGVAMSAVSIAYAFSKFIMGSVSDRSDARKFLVIGLLLSAFTMILAGHPVQSADHGIEYGDNLRPDADRRLAVRHGLASLRQDHGTLVLAE